MKKKTLILLLALTFTCFSISGCGLTENFTSQEEDEEEDENREEDEENPDEEVNEEETEVTDASDGQTFSCVNLHGTFEGCLSDTVELCILNDTECTITNTIVYQDDSADIITKHGTYELADGVYTVNYTYYNEEYIGEYTVEGTKITEFTEKYTTEDYSEVTGTYTCESDLGSMILEITEDGYATLQIDDRSYNGSIFVYEDEWDVMVNNDDYSESYDLMCTFNDDGTFEYYEYGYDIFEAFAGNYTASGELGEVTADILQDGTVNAVVPINGTNMELVGELYADTTDTNQMNITVRNEDETIVADLYLMKEDDAWTYTGVIMNYNYLPGYEDIEFLYY